MVSSLNQLEPDGLINSFLKHPPLGFEGIAAADSKIPCFTAKYNLLTTLDKSLLLVLRKIPGVALFSRLFLSPKALFVGTTVSEYLLLPRQVPKDLFSEVKALAKTKRARMIVFKDLPLESPLLSEEANRASKGLIEKSGKEQFLKMEGQALAYVPINFGSRAEYLERFSGSRRKDFKRKLKSESELKVSHLSTGDARFTDEIFLTELYQLYCNVYAQSEIHFDKLSFEFFRSVLQDSESGGVVFFYRTEKLIAFNLCFVCDGNLVDKYIGLCYPEARDLNIYFLSWFVNLDFAIRNKLRNYIAGWTDPEVKARLGAQFTMTSHLVYFSSPILRLGLRLLKPLFESDAHLLQEKPLSESINESV